MSFRIVEYFLRIFGSDCWGLMIWEGWVVEGKKCGGAVERNGLLRENLNGGFGIELF